MTIHKVKMNCVIDFKNGRLIDRVVNVYDY